MMLDMILEIKMIEQVDHIQWLFYIEQLLGIWDESPKKKDYSSNWTEKAKESAYTNLRRSSILKYSSVEYYL